MPSTAAPTAATVPAASEPGVYGSGGLTWYSPWQINASTKLTPAASTAMSTSPAPGAGSGRSTTSSCSSGPYVVATTLRTGGR